MHSAGLELTKLTYTRLEDNLIRHRGDRLKYTLMCHCCCTESAYGTIYGLHTYSRYLVEGFTHFDSVCAATSVRGLRWSST